jgi:K(+)-stimulated pyrophosphate-energized sodium pump
MSGTSLAAAGELSFSGRQTTYVIVAAAIALVALGFAAALVKAVLASGKAPRKCKTSRGRCRKAHRHI